MAHIYQVITRQLAHNSATPKSSTKSATPSNTINKLYLEYKYSKYKKVYSASRIKTYFLRFFKNYVFTFVSVN